MSDPTIIVETGSGQNPAANCYVSQIEAQAYFDAALQDGGWNAATGVIQAKAIISATRVLDASVDFTGFKANVSQPLQWPRILSRDRNQYSGAYWQLPDAILAQYFDALTVPKLVKDATCEMAKYLLLDNAKGKDRTGDAPGKGIAEFEVFEGVRIKFNTADQRPIIPDFITSMLQAVGNVRGGKLGFARIERT